MGKMCTLKVLPIFCDIPSLHLSSPPSTGKSFFLVEFVKFKTPVQGNSHYGAESKNKPEPEAHLNSVSV